MTTPTIDVADWQLFVYVVLGLFFLFAGWQGWQNGFNRNALMLVGIGVGYLGAQRFGHIVYDIYDSMIPYPLPIKTVMMDLAFGIMVYLVFVAGAVFVFKSTRKLKTPRERFSQGVGGILLGIIHGFVYLAIGIFALRVYAIRSVEIPPAPGSEEHKIAQEVQLPSHRKSSSNMSVNVVRAMLEDPLKPLVNTLLPLDEKYFEMMTGLKILSARPDIRASFLQSEAVGAILAQPAIAKAFSTTPELTQLMAESKFHALIKHPAVVELMEDEETVAFLKGVDWPGLVNDVIKETDLAAYPHL